MATPSRTLAWEIPWTEEPRGLQFMSRTRLSEHTHIIGYTPTQNKKCFLLFSHFNSPPQPFTPLVWSCGSQCFSCRNPQAYATFSRRTEVPWAAGCLPPSSSPACGNVWEWEWPCHMGHLTASAMAMKNTLFANIITLLLITNFLWQTPLTGQPVPTLHLGFRAVIYCHF